MEMLFCRIDEYTGQGWELLQNVYRRKTANML